MMREMLKSKIHRAVVTDANLNYEGSITIDKSLCEQADILEYEKVDIYNINNGARFSTYVIYGKDGEIILNGAAARLAQIGDLIIIASYANYSEEELKNYSPRIVMVDNQNHIIKSEEKIMF